MTSTHTCGCAGPSTASASSGTLRAGKVLTRGERQGFDTGKILTRGERQRAVQGTSVNGVQESPKSSMVVTKGKQENGSVHQVTEKSRGDTAGQAEAR